jgi:ABC-type transport system substrate-binding protein
MAETNYWNRVLTRRLSRRRALIGAGGFTASAAFLAACGGDDDDSGSSGSSGGNGGSSQGGGAPGATEVPDRSGEADVGGTLRNYGGGLSSVDSIGTTSTPDRAGASLLHNRLLRVLPGVNAPSSGEKVGDAAESWEYSGDGLTLTFKIRQNLGTDPRPPVDGRNLNAQDVMSSWQRWLAENTLVGDLVNEANPNAPILSGEATDDNTFVFKLAQPSALLLDQLTDGFYFWVMPREANEGVYDPVNESHGAGPYYLEELLPNAHTKMVRNPNFYDSPMPYFERQEWFSIPELAAQTAQWEAGQIDLGRGVPNVAGPVNHQNILDIMGRHPNAVAYPTPLGTAGITSRFGFREGQPFRDERIRQAISMMQDREALSEVFVNASALQAAGLPVEPRWATHLTAMWPEFWEDPSDPSSLDGNAKYFQYNIEEARKLLEAANFLNSEFVYHADSYNPQNIQISETLSGHINDAGLVSANQEVEDFVSWSIPNVYRGRGDYEGMFHGAIAYKFSPELHIYSHLTPGPGTAFLTQEIGEAVFPDLLARANALAIELDDEKRRQMLSEIQVMAAKQMPYLPTGAVSDEWSLAWPWVIQAPILNEWPGDGVAFRAPLFSGYWYDESKKS